MLVTEPEISIMAGLHPRVRNHIVVNGKFRVPLGEQGVPADLNIIMKHVVCAVTRTANYQAVNPFKDVFVFEGDINMENNQAFGQFNFDLMEHIHFNGAGTYYLLCSLGGFLSNVLSVTVPD